ncbi:MAG: hypothetical protein ISR90_06190 [Candidatus Marinimicrobia bacterium]|nr:hypothetical protein [Candidatus Neomarinimicrobiota bacterium]MBL7023621.1 hypothetical protein [Candidatus Neomarinimicrobiota bacterium]MBL7109808.1 hypothetical protein [Candidatus Neomarinimicrobiota bacterium]
MVSKKHYILLLVLFNVGLMQASVFSYESSDSSMTLKKHDLIPQYHQVLVDSEIIEKPMTGVILGGGVLHHKTTYSVSLKPYFISQNFAVGLNIKFLLSNNLQLRFEDFDDVFDYTSKIEFLNYSTRNDIFKFHIGEIKDMTLGYGHLMSEYTNQTYYPLEQKVGCKTDIYFGKRFVSLHSFISSFRDWTHNGSIVGIRSALYVSDNFPLTIGANVVSDLNQYASLSDSIFSVWDIENSRMLSGFSVDLTYELIKMYDYKLNIYSEGVGLLHPETRHFSRDIKETSRQGSWGLVFPGFHLKYKKSMEFRAELQFNSSLFIPSYFNSTYDLERVRYLEVDQSDADTLNWENLSQYNLFSPTDSTMLIPKDLYYPLIYGTYLYPTTGVKVGIVADISYIAKLGISYKYLQDFGAEEPKQYHTFKFKFTLNDGVLIGISKAEFYYENNFDEDIIKFSDFQENSILGCNLKFKVTKYFSIGCGVKSVFYDYDFDLNIDNMLYSHIEFGYSLGE